LRERLAAPNPACSLHIATLLAKVAGAGFAERMSMCGIAGYLNVRQPGADRRTLERFAAALAHRGPDGEGFLQDGAVGLAHRRLAIIDLTPTGAQPLLVEHIAVVVNGEIYNYRELREELRAAGQIFAGESDTEVLARAYLAWGPSFVHRLRGMWAFAIADREQGTLLCSRDPFGIKPFYYALHGGAFLFASEPAALFAAGVPARANLRRAAEYLAVGVCDHTLDTFFSGVEQLEPGALVRVDERGAPRLVERVRQRPEASVSSCSLEEFAASVRGSVHMHLRSDVPVGTCLSGGLDSSTIAALASAEYAAQSGRRFTAITAGCADPTRDERPYAASVAAHCELDWHTVVPDGEQFARDADDCIRAQGEPVLSPSAYYQYCVMRTARQLGLKVMLDGQGADELLGGYERYLPLAARDDARCRGVLAAMPEFVRGALGTTPGLGGMLGLAAYYWMPTLRRWTVRKRIAFMSAENQDVVYELLRSMAPAYQSLTAARIGDITRYSLPALLRCEDRNSMAHSVEARVPYVDREVASCAFRLPMTSLLQGGYSKYPVRRLAAQVLPAEIAWRKSKLGFEPPVGEWLAAISERMQSVVEQSVLIARLCRAVPRLDSMSSGMRWRLFNLASWERIFKVGVA
jgi:asparagine synthase (glutamine-hydrolysing)